MLTPIVLAQILIRVIAIYLISYGIIQFSGIRVSLFSSDSISFEWTAISFFSIPFIAGLFLWIVSEKLSLFMVGKNHESVKSQTLNNANIQTIAISIIGLIMFFNTVPHLIAQVILLFNESYNIDKEVLYNPQTILSVCVTLVKTLFAFSLIVGVHFWVQLLNNFRSFGLKEKVKECSQVKDVESDNNQ